jgi:hypothetical protein
MGAPKRIMVPIACLSLLAIGTCRAESNEFRSYGPFAVRSTGDGQLSTGVYSIEVRTSGKLAVSYIAPRLHCSSLRMHVLVDGAEKAVSGEVAPGKSTGYIDLGPVLPGNHVVALQAEGILGGCDTGRVVAWEGSAQVWTTLLPGDHSNLQENGLGELILEIGHQHYGDHFQSNGTYITQDGQVYRYATQIDAVPWLPSPRPNAQYAEMDLREKYSHSPLLMGYVVAPDFEDLKRAAYRVNSIGAAPVPVNAADPTRNGQLIDQTEYRVYRRQYANGDYDSELIAEVGTSNWANTSEDGVRVREWLERIARGEGYQPVSHIVCVTFPCPH